MKLKIIIHNAIRSVILGLLAALLCYYLWIKPNGGEYTFANYALDAVIYSVIFLEYQPEFTHICKAGRVKTRPAKFIQLMPTTSCLRSRQ